MVTPKPSSAKLSIHFVNPYSRHPLRFGSCCIIRAISSIVRSCTPIDPILFFILSVRMHTDWKLAAKDRPRSYLNLKDWNILK